MKNNNSITTGGAVVFKESNGKKLFLVVKQSNDSDWEIAKVTARRGESSVRAVLRMTSEQAGMNAKVLEEAYRANSTAFVNGKSVPQKHYFYLMLLRSSGEIFGFAQHKWLELAKAKNIVTLKREKEVFTGAKEVLKEWEKTHKLKAAY